MSIMSKWRQVSAPCAWAGGDVSYRDSREHLLWLFGLVYPWHIANVTIGVLVGAPGEKAAITSKSCCVIVTRGDHLHRS